jgi:glucose/arabinose dehydrogenase
LHDSDGDGRADDIRQFGQVGGVGLVIHHGHLYLGTDTAILRYRLDAVLAPVATPEVIVEGLPAAELHASKTLAFDEAGNMFVSIGAPSNACQQRDRSPASPGRDPCPETETAAGVWRFAAERVGQRFSDGERYASGIRHALAIDWEPKQGELYVVQHGRDELSQLWPQFYTAEQDELLPGEEMLKVTKGAVFSWPYCYYDPQQRRRVLAPEYGGDGMRTDRCTGFPEPVAVFPAHYSPNDMLVYRGTQFPKRYHGGAFIAFHGSYRPMGGVRVGYQVVFVPWSKAGFSGDWEVFADGFAGPQSGTALHRPTGLAEGPDGSLYIADSVSGRIWRIVYGASAAKGSLAAPKPAQGSAAAPPRSPESRDG